MITFYNQQQYLDLNFQDYIKLPGYSVSFLKREANGTGQALEITDKIKIGKLVDAILTDPKNADMADKLYPVAKEIAYRIKETFGDILKGLKAQVSYTGTVEHKYFHMPTKGRLDWELPQLAVLDLKVTYGKDFKKIIDWMQYKEQMFCYAGLAKVDKAFILEYNVPKKQSFVHYIDCRYATEWWCEKILKFGKVL